MGGVGWGGEAYVVLRVGTGREGGDVKQSGVGWWDRAFASESRSCCWVGGGWVLEPLLVGVPDAFFVHGGCVFLLLFRAWTAVDLQLRVGVHGCSA